MIKLNRLSLQARFLLGQTLGFVTIIVVLGIVEYWYNINADREDALRAGANYVHTFVELIAQQPDLFGTPQLQALVLRTFSKLPRLQRVTISDANLRIVADSEPDQIGRVADHPSTIKSMVSGRTQTDVAEGRGQRTIEQTFPILGPYDPQRKIALLGLITVQMDLTASEAGVLEGLFGLMFWFIALLAALLGVEAWLLRRYWFSRLTQIKSALDRIKNGDYGTRAVDAGTDEIGALAAGFNSMGEAIETARAQTQAEAKVREGAEVALAKTNRELAESLRELEIRSHQITTLAEMGIILHSCTQRKEVYELLPSYITRLFPESSGGLYILSPSRDLLERGAIWGDDTRIPGRMSPEECWALRRGQMHLVALAGNAPVCAHVGGGEVTGAYACVPMMAQNETVGLLYLRKGPGKEISDASQNILKAVGEQVSLSLSNLRLRESMRQQSIRDPLTGMFNRRYLEESFNREIARVERKSAPLAFVLLDVDHFKRFNDTFGHEAGDAVLRTIAQTLMDHIRASDLASRFGGEEFAVLLPEATLEQACEKAEVLRKAIQLLNLHQSGKPLGPVTASFGVASWPRHGKTMAELMKAADMALYDAKGQGRNRVVVAAGEPSAMEM